MTGNANPKDDVKVIRAQTRLLKAYSRLRKNGGWRALADLVGVNVRYVWEFVMQGVVPSNDEVREKLMNWPVKKEKMMNAEMRKLHDIIKYEHVGAANGIKKHELLKVLYGLAVAEDKSYNNRKDRGLRKMIEQLIHDHGALICSSPKFGYFWPSTLQEGLRAVDRLDKRARVQMENKSHLERNLQQTFGGQLEF